MASTAAHHVGICPADMDTSLSFYRDGLGLSVLVDAVLEMDLQPLLGASTSSVRTVFLGDPRHPDTGIIELLDLRDGVAPGQDEPPGLPRRGAFLVSFQMPVEPALDRLRALGLGGTPRRVPVPGGGVAATVVDPDGTVIELLGQPVSLVSNPVTAVTNVAPRSHI
jgi:catechol 2,3-dioxygenase-like lactoylglutathione lyase family enzyme